MTKRYNYIYYTAYLIAALLGCISCISDTPPTPDGENWDTALVTLNLNAAGLKNPATRASGNFTDAELAEGAAAANELIKNWTMVFFRGNEVVKVVSGNPATEISAGVWNDKVQVELPRGTYSALAFANLNDEKVCEMYEGKTIVSDWKDSILDENLLSEDGDLIPMSGYLEDFTVRGTVNEQFAIEVVRMMAKIEYSIKNLSSERISVESISLTPVYGGPIYLFPEYDRRPMPDTQNPDGTPRYPEAESVADLSSTYTASVADDFVLQPESGEAKRGCFYIKESVATRNHPTDHFHILLALKRGEGEAEDVTYALAADDLTAIWRNDHILFPISISDCVPEFEVYDYPPIGGYPVSVEEMGNQFYANFSSSGEFDIRARLRDGRGNTVAIQPYDGSGTQENYVRYVGSVPENFSLTYDPSLETWHGYFHAGAGKHIVLTFKFKIGDIIYDRELHLRS